ncbi:hypothetical protein LTR02_012270 [Friedmanniomyces endolithicus]|nr:hypothetical protein LTR94_015442 [Friedmanniomyces endolithicus]KAK0782569.1 hypothetical protein LTR38_013315 [Friedmanniomyces endolithicus]KAK0784932.1 hypothetical protein LTR59_011211 [Friedmanniomyces endolithicus]KAK0816097.1 hypothetical protein LTR75_003670 [Friedmanniomyces endolithicus]KAK0853990.1 hypothetical protein LTR03_002618 [Friedmanniomyces endolithicus]
MAQTCVSLADSTACPAFNASSISTDSALVGLFSFLSSVTDTASFDSGIQTYIANGFTQLRYQTLIGCSNVNLDNTTDFYARYTTSVLCNAIIQNSINPCGLSGNAARPLCAESCASYAQSEEDITSSDVCGTSSNYALTQIRADFTNCALPSNSLTGTCIQAEQNQPDNCGYSTNVGGLCGYCSASSPNATDSCCVFSNAPGRCAGVVLPIIASSSLQPVTMTSTSTTSGTSSATSTGTGGLTTDARRGLTGGQIAGIVVGSVLGALLLLALLIVGCLLLRRRRDSSPATSVFNQPASTRQQPPMEFNDGARDQERAGLAVLPGGRVARMSALEGSSGSEHNDARYMPLGYGGYRKSTSDEEGTPDSRRMLQLAPPPKRSGSLSSGSQLAIAGADDTSPSTDQQYTSPESQGQSELLGFFKDYYSQDEIHPADIVATLWAYEPRAADEFQLDRGDMIKVLGIWDDGWATGVRIRRNAEDWRPEDKTQRDSGLSTGSEKTPDSPDGDGEVKAFPLVCVCLPQHWRQTIEGHSTEGSGPGAYPSELP